MKKDNEIFDKSENIRILAEKRFEKRNIGKTAKISPEIKKIIIDNLIRQIELEMQNEELISMRLIIESIRDKYLNVHNLEPAKTFTIDELERRIKERKDKIAKVTKALQSTEEVCSKIANSICDALVISDVYGNIVYANDKFKYLFKYTEDELSNINIKDCLVPKYPNRVPGSCKKNTVEENTPSYYEHMALNKYGERFSCEVSAISVYENGNIIGIKSCIRKISEYGINERNSSIRTMWQHNSLNK